MANRFQGLRDFIWAMGGRKYVMAMGCAAVNTVLFAIARLTESGYLTVLGGTIFAYLVADGAQTWKQADVGKPNG